MSLSSAAATSLYPAGGWNVDADGRRNLMRLELYAPYRARYGKAEHTFLFLGNSRPALVPAWCRLTTKPCPLTPNGMFISVNAGSGLSDESARG